MAFQWWAQRGDGGRTGFVCLENAYHGDTLGAVSVGGIDTFHSLYRPLLFDTWRARAGDANDLRRVLSRHGDSVAAVIVEPLVQGAAGIRLQPAGYLRQVRELCDEHGVLLICDEVATGFGRTGRMFACQHEGVTPDLLCLGKGLTGGYLPLAATLTTERIYEGFLGDATELRTFFHGHTYTGNPLACAAALATLEVFEREATLEGLGSKIELLERNLARRVAVLPLVAEVRQRGFMVGIELARGDAGRTTGSSGNPGGAGPRRDNPAAGRCDRAHAATEYLRARPVPARGHHRVGHRRRRPQPDRDCSLARPKRSPRTDLPDSWTIWLRDMPALSSART
jgi:adenosylmethionine---8-amino-7-oxononanoate aminotransferase